MHKVVKSSKNLLNNIVCAKNSIGGISSENPNITNICKHLYMHIICYRIQNFEILHFAVLNFAINSFF